VERARMGELAEIMSELAAGDETAVFALYERFGDKIGGTVRAVLRARGLTLVHDEVDGLVLEACLAIAGVAGAWSPDGGALPWVYARRRIENCVDRVVGQYTVPLDDYLRAVEDGEAGYPPFTPPGGHAPLPVDDRSLAQVLEEMSPGDDRCRLLHDALDRAAVSPTDRELTLQYAAEQGSGNRSPATTVAAMFDLRDAAVRQRVHRSKRRLRAVAASEQRFAPLADLPLLA
jgi:DNA-directed RNA polymerase specialized sigma24 family protein